MWQHVVLQVCPLSHLGDAVMDGGDFLRHPTHILYHLHHRDGIVDKHDPPPPVLVGVDTPKPLPPFPSPGFPWQSFTVPPPISSKCAPPQHKSPSPPGCLLPLGNPRPPPWMAVDFRPPPPLLASNCPLHRILNIHSSGLLGIVHLPVQSFLAAHPQLDAPWARLGGVGREEPYLSVVNVLQPFWTAQYLGWIERFLPRQGTSLSCETCIPYLSSASCQNKQF